MTNSIATVEVLTAEVHVLMVGSRQVTMSVYGQLDEVDYDDMEPFGRVRPKGDDDRICLVGRSKASGTLVRARIPGSQEAIAREVGFSDLEYQRLGREVSAADKSAAHYANYAEAWFSGTADQPGGGKGAELAAQYRERAEQIRETMRAMLEKYWRDRQPLLVRKEDAEELPLIVLAGLR